MSTVYKNPAKPNPVGVLLSVFNIHSQGRKKWLFKQDLSQCHFGKCDIEKVKGSQLGAFAHWP